MAAPKRKKVLRETGNLLVVEGKRDLYALAELCERLGTDWMPPPVFIQEAGGLTNLDIQADLDDDGALRIGYVIDADPKVDQAGRVLDESRKGAAERAYESLYNQLKDRFDSLPDRMPDGGAVSEVHDGKRVGVWIMPDNSERGMLETLLSHHGGGERSADRVRRCGVQGGEDEGGPI